MDLTYVKLIKRRYNPEIINDLCNMLKKLLNEEICLIDCISYTTIQLPILFIDDVEKNIDDIIKTCNEKYNTNYLLKFDTKIEEKCKSVDYLYSNNVYRNQSIHIPESVLRIKN